MPANNKSKFTMIAVLGAIFLGAILCALPFLSKQLGRALIAETATNGRSTKLVMDIFASDNDGLYPGEDSAEFYEIAGSATSNDLFKQLFSSGNMNSEKHFWIKGAKICNENKPDDAITIDEKFNPPETLKAGDNGWSYFAGLKTPTTPTIPSSPPPSTTTSKPSTPKFSKEEPSSSSSTAPPDPSPSPTTASPQTTWASTSSTNSPPPNTPPPSSTPIQAQTETITDN